MSGCEILAEKLLDLLMNDSVITGIFTLLGGVFGFLLNSKLVKLQAKKELYKSQYKSKEALYTDIISFLPQMVLSIDKANKTIKLSENDTIMLNSFKARLLLYSPKNICQDFYQLVDDICAGSDNISDKINRFDNLLIEDLKKTMKKV